MAADTSMPVTDPAVIALSLGYKTGWALRHPSGAAETGTMEFYERAGERHGLQFARFTHWLNSLNRAPGGIPVVRFWIERNPVRNMDTQVYDAMVGVLTCWCEVRGKNYGGYGDFEMRKYASANFAAPDEELIRGARAWGYHVKNEQEAKAVHLLRYALEEKRK